MTVDPDTIETKPAKTIQDEAGSPFNLRRAYLEVRDYFDLDSLRTSKATSIVFEGTRAEARALFSFVGIHVVQKGGMFPTKVGDTVLMLHDSRFGVPKKDRDITSVVPVRIKCIDDPAP